MSYVHLRMFCDKVHFLIKCLYPCHVSSCVIGKFHLLSSADALGAPVEVAHVYRAANLSCDGVESCLPTFYRLACAFWSQCQMDDLLCLHLLDYAECDIAASLSVHRDASHLAEQPSERAPEQFAFDHAVRLSAYRYIIKVGDYEIPDRRVRYAEDNAFVFRGYWVNSCPTQCAE